MIAALTLLLTGSALLILGFYIWPVLLKTRHAVGLADTRMMRVTAGAARATGLVSIFTAVVRFIQLTWWP